MNPRHPIRRTAPPIPIWALALVALGAAYRIAVPVFDLPWNTAPLMAMAFGGALLAGGRAWWMPVLVLLISDLVLGLLRPGEGLALYTLVSALFYLAAARAGVFVGKRTRHWLALWSGTLLCALLFYLVSNTYAWAIDPGYAKTASAWWQSQTTGLPQYAPPAWVFLRNSILADTLWCVAAGLVQFFVGLAPSREAIEPTAR